MDQEREDYADEPDRRRWPLLLKSALVGLAVVVALPVIWFAFLLIVYGRGK
jgi:hypothetical protein